MTRERLGLGLGLGPGHECKAKGVEDQDEDEGFLFGGFSIADAFYWPVLWVCLRSLVGVYFCTGSCCWTDVDRSGFARITCPLTMRVPKC